MTILCKIHCKYQTLLIHPMNSLLRPPPYTRSTQQLIQLSFRLHINASIFPSVDPTTNFINSWLRPLNVFIYPFIRPSTYVFIHPFIQPSIWNICLFITSSIHTHELYNLSARQKSLLQLSKTYTSSPHAALTCQDSVLTYPRLDQIIPKDYWSFVQRRQIFSKLRAFQLLLTIWRLYYVNVYFLLMLPDIRKKFPKLRPLVLLKEWYKFEDNKTDNVRIM